MQENIKMHEELIRFRNKLLAKIKKTDTFLNVLGTDNVFVAGLSGGIDSLTMLDLLFHYKAKNNLSFNLHAVFIDNSLKNLKNADVIQKFVEERRFIFAIIQDTSSKIIIEKRLKPFRPCFVCSRERRRLLLEYASKIGARKILLAHTLDDVLETLFLNMFYSRGISTLMPLQPLFNGEYYISRPIILLEKKEIIKYAYLARIPMDLEGKCISEDENKRKIVREFLGEIYKKDPKIKNNLKHALFGYNQDFMWTKFREIKTKLIGS